MNRIFKIVVSDTLSSLSSTVTPEYGVDYHLFKWTEAPPLFAAANFHLLAFEDIGTALLFARKQPSVRALYLALGDGRVPLPPARMQDLYKWGERITYTLNRIANLNKEKPSDRAFIATELGEWPIGTVMYKRIMLVRKVTGRMLINAGLESYLDDLTGTEAIEWTTI